jgi:hypothetical protein
MLVTPGWLNGSDDGGVPQALPALLEPGPNPSARCWPCANSGDAPNADMLEPALASPGGPGRRWSPGIGSSMSPISALLPSWALSSSAPSSGLVLEDRPIGRWIGCEPISSYCEEPEV